MCYLCDAIAPICRWKALRALRTIEDMFLDDISSSEAASEDDLSVCGACGPHCDQDLEATGEANQAAPQVASQRLAIFRQGTNRPRPAESVKPAS